MTEIFHRYEQEFSNDIEAVKTKLNQPIQSKDQIKQIRAILSECQKNIKLMQTQLSIDMKPQKAKAVDSLRKYKSEYNSIKKQLFTIQNNLQYELNKKELLSTRPNSSSDLGRDKMAQVNDRLKESVKVMYQNFQIGENVEAQLHRQTGKMLNSKGKVIEMRDDLVKGERKIKSMMMRIRKNKLILRGVLGIIFIVFVIILVSYFK